MNGSDPSFALIGIPGSGKSSVAAALAERLRTRWVDLDTEIEKRRGTSIPEIFATQGESAFRKFETAALDSALAGARVISCGGGIVISQRNRELLKAPAVVCVWLTVGLDVAVERVADDGCRPLIPDDLTAARTRMAELLRRRRRFYFICADQVVATDRSAPEEVADTICRRLAL